MAIEWANTAQIAELRVSTVLLDKALHQFTQVGGAMNTEQITALNTEVVRLSVAVQAVEDAVEPE